MERILTKMATSNKEVSNLVAGIMVAKNPRRVAAGKLNRTKRQGLSPAGWERLRQTAAKKLPLALLDGAENP